MLEIRQIKLPIKSDKSTLDFYVAKSLSLKKLFGNDEIEYSYEIVRKSIDARKKPELYYIYSVRVSFSPDNGRNIDIIEKTIIKMNNNRKNRDKYDMSICDVVEYKAPSFDLFSDDNKRPVIIGSGPAGLFCAFILAKCNLKPILLERGEDVDKRIKDVDAFWQNGELKINSNVQFGEGGAGTFSDGKLNTLTKDKFGRQSFVLDTFVRFGANPRIKYDAKPHIGTDVLSAVVKSMREEIISLGGEVRFNSLVTKIETVDNRVSGVVINDCEKLSCDDIVLAIGHSARDTFLMLKDIGADMEQKSFAVGFRVQHPQDLINRSQYGDNYSKVMEAAPYKVTNTASNGRRVYSFCMCPGGFVVNASSEDGRCCVNGMSYSGRDSQMANSAIIIGIEPSDFCTDRIPASDDPLLGMYYQREIEEKAYVLGKGNIPAQAFLDFEKINNGESDDNLYNDESLLYTKGNAVFSNLTGIFTKEMNDAFVESMHRFGKIIEDFDGKEAIMYGVEARTSSPVHIVRNDDFVSNIEGLYPCGEGAGYAGGIMSAAVDGIKVAEAVINKYKKDI